MILTFFRRLWSNTNAARVADLEAQLLSLSKRLDLQAQTIAHQHHRSSEQATLITNLTAQLAVTRAMLAAVMRERDEAQTSDERHKRVLATVMKRRREEVANLRSWMTRVSAYHVSSN